MNCEGDSLSLRAFGRCSDAPLVRDIGQVSSGPIEQDRVAHVRGARVVCANYRALVHDFPHVFGAEARREAPLPGCDVCAASGKLCTKAINAWLIRNSAFVSLQQALPNAVNSPIDVDDEVKIAYRPPKYGRAVVVRLDTPAGKDEPGFLDLKGVGVAPGKTPSHQPHSSGLEYLGFAIADFFYGWLVDTIFARTCPRYHVLPVYAVLDLGFDIIGGGHGTAPAGLHVRRAHARPMYMPRSGSAHEKLMLHVEFLLRSFGLTTSGYVTAFRLSSSGEDPLLTSFGRPVSITTDAEKQKAAQIVDAIRESGGDQLDVLNIQSTSEADWEEKILEIFDFGQVEACSDFTDPLANAIRDGALKVGRIISPTHASFVRPNKKIAVDPDLCSRDSVNAYGFYVAQGFRHAAKHFNQRRIESILRLARLKVLGRDADSVGRRRYARGAR
jgi:hypothetical protein